MSSLFDDTSFTHRLALHYPFLPFCLLLALVLIFTAIVATPRSHKPKVRKAIRFALTLSHSILRGSLQALLCIVSDSSVLFPLGICVCASSQLGRISLLAGCSLTFI